MRHIKPQSGLLQVAPSQIGSAAFVGVAAGIGFRLSDPRVIAHEATVWEALKAAPRSAPLPAPMLRRRHAEWLLMGHSVQGVPAVQARRTVDWVATCRLDNVVKSVSCAALAGSETAGAWFARLALDHTHATRGPRGENPAGLDETLTPPLQLVGKLGIAVSPLAGTGPTGTEWPQRQQWMPARPGRIEDMVRDGTHMGWPAAIDPRYFQLAPSNQWHADPAWPAGSAFELLAFGPRGEGYRGRLPALRPRLFYTHRDAGTARELACDLQAAWFLPDHDLGVLWWNGAIEAGYFDDDQIDEVLLAFQESNQPDVPRERLLDFARRRTDLQERDPMLQADSVLMPPLERGWVWEIIVDSSDHPRFDPTSKGHAQACDRLAAHHELLGDASARLVQVQEEQRRLSGRQPAPDVLPDGCDWPARLRAAAGGRLDNEVVRGQVLEGIVLSGWTFKSTRFEGCSFARSTLSHCVFEDVVFDHCDLGALAVVEGRLENCALRECDLSRSNWTGVVLRATSLERCRLDEYKARGGLWQRLCMSGCRGVRGGLSAIEIDSWTCEQSTLDAWRLESSKLDGWALLSSDASRLSLSQCELTRPSVIESTLVDSRWVRCNVRMAVMSAGVSVARAQFLDCLVQNSCWSGMDATGIQVAHCSFPSLSAQRLHAPSSLWRAVVLDKLDAMHANFSRARFELCSLCEAGFHGADLSETCIEECNLVGARTGWALTSVRPAFSGNLDTDHMDLPRRHA